ncbi:MAG: hypothetical protein HQL45_10220 [Alphaproteobacteria bacterium]|nr:hypothetical protein [Alphaproteobacteria bacterium]
MKTNILLSVGLAVMLCACAPARPELDLSQITDHTKLAQDYSVCKNYAEMGFIPSNYKNPSPTYMNPPNAAAGVATGAMSGAVVGAASGAVGAAIAGGNVGSGAGIGAGGGLIVGALMAPLLEKEQEERDINTATARCLEDKGYRITNRGSLRLIPFIWCWNYLLNRNLVMGKEDGKACLAYEEKRMKELGIPGN